jgi:hypothetical protein
MHRRHLVAALGGATFGVRAQSSRRSFAVLSEFARDVHVVMDQPAIGSRLGNNVRERIPIANGAFDKLALGVAKRSIDAAEPGARVWLIAPLDANLMDGADTLLEGSKVRLPDDLAAALKDQGSTHLIALTSLREEARLKAADTRLGSGVLEGLGFYVDRSARMQSGDTQALTRGFIAPYVHVRATLVDVATRTVVGTRRIVESHVIAADRAEQSGDPWNLMTTDEKFRLLSEMLRQHVGEHVRQLVAAR